MLKPNQLRLIHMAARDVGLIEGKNDTAYRTLLRSTAGVDSATELDNVTFEDCMAVLEDMGFSYERAWHRDKASFTGAGGSATRVQSTYWRDKVARRGRRCNERFVFKIRELVPKQRYPLGALCMQFSGGNTADVEQLAPQEAWKLIEMLKAATAREGTKAQRHEGTEGKDTEDSDEQLAIPF
jgi:hypothetical protein